MTLREIIEADAGVLVQDLGVDAVYRSGGQGDSVALRVKLTTEPERLQSLRAGRMTAVGRTHDARTYRLMVPLRTTDGTAVDLRVGDTFQVPAAEFGEAGDGVRILRVTGDVYRPTAAAWWHCRVQP